MDRFSPILDQMDHENPMLVALSAYLSDMPESEKLAIVAAQWANYAFIATMMADELYGSDSTVVLGA